MDTSTGTSNGGEQRFLTIHEFCIWAEITQTETEEEIRSGVNQRAKLTRQPGISALNFDHPG